jgi:hypothetical protein
MGTLSSYKRGWKSPDGEDSRNSGGKQGKLKKNRVVRGLLRTLEVLEAR